LVSQCDKRGALASTQDFCYFQSCASTTATCEASGGDDFRFCACKPLADGQTLAPTPPPSATDKETTKNSGSTGTNDGTGLTNTPQSATFYYPEPVNI